MAGCKLNCSLGWFMDDWSDFELRLVIYGPPFSWKRARQVITIPARGGKQGHSSIGLNTAAKKWARNASMQLKDQWGRVFGGPIPKTIPINAAIVSYLPTRRLTDASNLYQGPEDVMQACFEKCKTNCKMHGGVLEDDSSIESHNGSARLYDKKTPRVEIVLTRSPRKREP